MGVHSAWSGVGRLVGRLVGRGLLLPWVVALLVLSPGGKRCWKQEARSCLLLLLCLVLVLLWCWVACGGLQMLRCQKGNAAGAFAAAVVLDNRMLLLLLDCCCWR